MHELKDVTAVALDVADRNQSKEHQETLAELILYLLERSYQVFLWTSRAKDDFGDEEFTHALLTILTEQPPFPQQILADNPVLSTKNVLWVTESAEVQALLTAQDALFCYLQRSSEEAGGFKLSSLGELTQLLNPTRELLLKIEACLRERQAAKGHAPLLVGIGGPPMSGYPRFALELKQFLEGAGFDLVEMLNLNPLMAHADQEAPLKGEGSLWIDDGAREWLLAQVLRPLGAGHRIYLETMPKQLPADFSGHFPIHVTEESVLLVLGEMLFVPPVTEWLDLRLLLDVAPAEITRRLFEIPRYEPFDAKFEEQYLQHEGRQYSDYLQRFDVVRRIDYRIDANNPDAFLPHAQA